MTYQTQKAIVHGAIGFGLGMMVSAFVLGKEIAKLEKENKTSFELHKQLVNDTKKDLEDVTMSTGEQWSRMAQRLNFITTSKLI
jgi:hypothetical protein